MAGAPRSSRTPTTRAPSASDVYQTEFALVAAPLALAFVVYTQTRSVELAAVAFALILILLATIARNWTMRQLHASRTRRRWGRALHHTGLDWRRARIQRIEQTWSGPALHVALSHGLSFDVLRRERASLESALHAAEIRIQPDPVNSSRGQIVLDQRGLEPLATDWPVPDRPSFWEPMPFGHDQHGQPVTISLTGRHMLVGGTTGAGKSVALSACVAWGALDPTVLLYLLDAKGGLEFNRWECCARLMSRTVEQGIAALEEVERVMDDRIARMDRLRLRDLAPKDKMAPVLVVIDELAQFTNHPDKKLKDRFSELLWRLLALGRAPCVTVIAATQRPSANMMSTDSRGNFPHRFALRMMDPQGSTMILGESARAKGICASDIANKHKGAGWLLTEEASPRLIHTHHLRDADIDQLVTRARKARRA